MSCNISINELMEIVHGQYLGGNTRRYWDPHSRTVHAQPCVEDPVALAVVREVAASYDATLTYEAQMAKTAAVLREIEFNVAGIAEILERSLEA